MYSREIDGKTYTFGVSGKLWRDALLMYDHQTRSLWSHITGEAIQGKLKGKKLTPLISMPQIAWKTWMANYPQTRVLSVRNQESLERDNYANYHKSQRAGVSGTQYTDKRLPNKSLVIGVQIKDKNGKKHYRAYPLTQFAKTALIQDTVNGVALLIFHNKDSFATAVYKRNVDGKVENFELKDDYLSQDSQGRQWNLITGKVTSSKQQDVSLERLTALNIYWFAWARFYPNTSIYKP